MSLPMLRVSARAYPAASRVVRPKCVTAAQLRSCFYKSSSRDDYEEPEKEIPLREKLSLAFQQLKEDWKLLKEEAKEYVQCDPRLYYHGDSEVFWRFDSTKAIDKWTVTTDKDNGEGFSTAEFSLSPGNTGIFSGVLDTRPPKGSRVKRAGYCNLRSERAYKAFNRTAYYDWSPFTHLLFRVRGDGRSYMINLGMDGHFDITWNILYNFVLYTRGGPYWQVAKIPFSKFLVSNKGRVQDKQCPIARNRVTHLSLTVADGVPGPFRLEIDYIGGYVDEGHTEEFAYEMYEMPSGYVAGY